MPAHCRPLHACSAQVDVKRHLTIPTKQPNVFILARDLVVYLPSQSTYSIQYILPPRLRLCLRLSAFTLTLFAFVPVLPQISPRLARFELPPVASQRAICSLARLLSLFFSPQFPSHLAAIPLTYHLCLALCLACIPS
ncbi:hypothetical protein GGR51DRAFT_496897 [Nemania sp. FL0031]|nr:hypothetical protein GGR51DRAFT_496897 [Nemania sp. FL0031]